MNCGWEDCVLGEMITLKRGYDLPSRERDHGEVPVISSSGTTGYHNVPKVAGPGVVTGRYGTLGEVFYVDSDFWPLNTALYVQDFKGNHPRFISYFLRVMNLSHQNAAGAVPGVNRNALHKLPVRRPPLQHQERIVEILSTYDDLIENNTRRIAVLEEMAQTIYRAWFVNFRFPGHEQVEMVESELGPVPAGWEILPMERLCDFVSRGVTPKYVEGSRRYIINQKANRGSTLSLTDLKELDPALAVPAEKYARKRDVLINSLGEGTIGRTHYFTGPDAAWAVDQHMSICRSSMPGVTAYLYEVLASPEGQNQIQASKTGATNMTMFNISALRAFPVLCPGHDLVRAYHRSTEPMRALRQTLTDANERLRCSRDLLLPRLISGEIKVAAMEDERAGAVV